jgi:organic hydroperoxide reductase OsmC/OhrA
VNAGSPRAHGYAVGLVWTGASAGATRSYAGYSREHELVFEGGKPVLAASADPFFRGDRARYNPEELLVAALVSCHMLSYLTFCALEAIEIVAYTDRAEGTLEERGGTGAFSRVTLRPHAIVNDDRIDRARSLHRDAHAACFIANSVNFPVTCEPAIERFVP